MSLRIALLGLLSFFGPASGYDLTKKFELSINHVWQAGHSQIYPELGKMATDGLITVEAEGPRGRKIYTITPEGTAEVHRWMVEHVPAEPMRSEGALQAFLLPVLEPQEALAVLARLRASTQAKLEGLEALQQVHHRRRAETGHVNLGHYSLELGIMHTRTTLAWLENTMAEIESEPAAR
ncbi:PadR family transcriptional regulator [Sphaerisporangium fuscum]|uniref:PadR family transcriptional regulator n=1 Tax=Sphaerisporangium fuscum TaxID=2835868 RepID=UPI001BDC994E|nr:PadR family transcriptional regulator [Sphaerisporangium fuscum]